MSGFLTALNDFSVEVTRGIGKLKEINAGPVSILLSQSELFLY